MKKPTVNPVVTLPGWVGAYEDATPMDSNATLIIDTREASITLAANGTSVTVLVMFGRQFWDVVDAIKTLGPANHWNTRPTGSAHMDKRYRNRCPDCGKTGERKGHQDCQFPS